MRGLESAFDHLRSGRLRAVFAVSARRSPHSCACVLVSGLRLPPPPLPPLPARSGRLAAAAGCTRAGAERLPPLRLLALLGCAKDVAAEGRQRLPEVRRILGGGGLLQCTADTCCECEYLQANFQQVWAIGGLLEVRGATLSLRVLHQGSHKRTSGRLAGPPTLHILMFLAPGSPFFF